MTVAAKQVNHDYHKDKCLNSESTGNLSFEFQSSLHFAAEFFIALKPVKEDFSCNFLYLDTQSEENFVCRKIFFLGDFLF